MLYGNGKVLSCGRDVTNYKLSVIPKEEVRELSKLELIEKFCLFKHAKWEGAKELTCLPELLSAWNNTLLR